MSHDRIVDAVEKAWMRVSFDDMGTLNDVVRDEVASILSVGRGVIDAYLTPFMVEKINPLDGFLDKTPVRV